MEKLCCKPRTPYPTRSQRVKEASKLRRRNYDAMLIEISKDFHQDEDIGPSINQQLADIINKSQSAKLTDIKIKENLKQCARPANSQKLSVLEHNMSPLKKEDLLHSKRITLILTSFAKGIRFFVVFFEVSMGYETVKMLNYLLVIRSHIKP